MVVTVLASGNNVGKTLIVDYESDDFKPWRDSLRERFAVHYAEYFDYDTGETFWQKFQRKPGSRQMYMANTIIKQNDDGTFSYIKNRKSGDLGKVSEEELMWIILKAG
jgi:hypothetical protein